MDFFFSCFLGTFICSLPFLPVILAFGDKEEPHHQCNEIVELAFFISSEVKRLAACNFHFHFFSSQVLVPLSLMMHAAVTRLVSLLPTRVNSLANMMFPLIDIEEEMLVFRDTLAELIIIFQKMHAASSPTASPTIASVHKITIAKTATTLPNIKTKYFAVAYAQPEEVAQYCAEMAAATTIQTVWKEWMKQKPRLCIPDPVIPIWRAKMDCKRGIVRKKVKTQDELAMDRFRQANQHYFKKFDDILAKAKREQQAKFDRIFNRTRSDYVNELLERKRALDERLRKHMESSFF